MSEVTAAATFMSFVDELGFTGPMAAVGKLVVAAVFRALAPEDEAFGSRVPEEASERESSAGRWRGGAMMLFCRVGLGKFATRNRLR
jgi:hypothetical protein